MTPLLPPETRRWIRVAGTALGVVVAAGALVAWRLPAPSGPPPAASVAVLTSNSGELDVTPKGRVLWAELRPGPEHAAERAQVEVRNRTGRGQHVTVSVVPDSPDLDEVVWLTLTSRGTELFRGTVRDLRRGSLPLSMGIGAARHVELAAWVPEGTTAGYQARAVELALQLSAGRR